MPAEQFDIRIPDMEEIEDMLSEVARAIEADLAREAEQERDPDDDPDPHQPGGGGAASRGGSKGRSAHTPRDAPHGALVFNCK